MLDFYVVTERIPMSLEHLCDEASVAFLRPRFGAEQRNLSFEVLGFYSLQHFPPLHQFQKRFFIMRPVARLAVRDADFRTGCQERLVLVARAQNPVEEERKVRVFGKACELAKSVLSNVDDLLDSRLLKQVEEFFGGLLGEPDGEER